MPSAGFQINVMAVLTKKPQEKCLWEYFSVYIEAMLLTIISVLYL